MSTTLSQAAAHLSFIREVGGPNAGSWVEFLQRTGGDGVKGDSWCADFESVLEMVVFGAQTRTPRTGSCQAKLDYARKKGWIVATPAVDDIYFFVNDDGHAHHVGIVTGVSPLSGIAGNTSQDGASSNGDGVYDHPLNVQPKHIVFARLPQ